MIALHLVSPGRGGRSTDVRAIIDTGFTDWLTLPPDVVRYLELPLRGSADVMLPDGSVAALRIYRVGLVWHGRHLRLAGKSGMTSIHRVGEVSRVLVDHIHRDLGRTGPEEASRPARALVAPAVQD